MKQFLFILFGCPIEEIARLARLARARDGRFWTEFPLLGGRDLQQRVLRFMDKWVNDTFEDVDWDVDWDVDGDDRVSE